MRIGKIEFKIEYIRAEDIPYRQGLIFPGNPSHHHKHTLYSPKMGGGLAVIAEALTSKRFRGRFALSLPTTGMDIVENEIILFKDAPVLAQDAICDLYRALGVGLDLLLPVRGPRPTENEEEIIYFSEKFIDIDAIVLPGPPVKFKILEPNFWGLSELTPNVHLGDFYVRQLIVLSNFLKDHIFFSEDDSLRNHVEGIQNYSRDRGLELVLEQAFLEGVLAQQAQTIGIYTQPFYYEDFSKRKLPNFSAITSRANSAVEALYALIYDYCSTLVNEYNIKPRLSVILNKLIYCRSFFSKVQTIEGTEIIDVLSDLSIISRDEPSLDVYLDYFYINYRLQIMQESLFLVNPDFFESGVTDGEILEDSFPILFVSDREKANFLSIKEKDGDDDQKSFYISLLNSYSGGASDQSTLVRVFSRMKHRSGLRNRNASAVAGIVHNIEDNTLPHLVAINEALSRLEPSAPSSPLIKIKGFFIWLESQPGNRISLTSTSNSIRPEKVTYQDVYLALAGRYDDLSSREDEDQLFEHK